MTADDGWPAGPLDGSQEHAAKPPHPAPGAPEALPPAQSPTDTQLASNASPAPVAGTTQPVAGSTDGPAARDSTGRFLPGNKSVGRVRVPAEFRELCRRASPAAMAIVLAIMSDKTASNRDRLAAATIVLERAWGKATQPITGEGGGPIGIESISKAVEQMTTAELRDRLESLRMRRAKKLPPGPSDGG